MEFIVVGLTALAASALTLYSGFGLGTLLLPAFSLFFPIELAVAMTAVVHFLNNLFKLLLLGRHTDRHILIAFGLPAILAALLGAWVLTWLAGLPPIGTLIVMERTFSITIENVAIGSIMIVFALLEWFNPARLQMRKRHWIFGGLASGFFGGLSGHQGALRSAFLVHSGLTKEAFIGTGVAIACLVDIGRLSVYSVHFATRGLDEHLILIAWATALAFTGAYGGSRLLHKMTIRHIQSIVAVMLLGIGGLLILGIL